MKIIGGKFKGRNFYMPAGIRPTQNIARKAIFDMLGQDLTGMSVLDLFAGSGAVGLEAVSRNAQRVALVEKDPKCVKVIEENFGELRRKDDPVTAGDHEVIMLDAFAAIKQLSRQGSKFDFVFIDPPFGRGLAKKSLKTLYAYDILQPNCVVVIEHDKREILPEVQGRFLAFRQKKHGNSLFSMYKISAEQRAE